MIKNSYDIVSFFTFDKRILELYDRWEILWTLEILQAFYSFKGAGIHKISADYIYTLMLLLIESGFAYHAIITHYERIGM